MSDILLDFLTTLSITNEYLSYPVTDIPYIHYAITKYTKSPNVIAKYQNFKYGVNFDSIKYERFNIYQIKQNKPDNHILIKLYILQLRLEIIMSEFIFATGTISRLKDLLGQLGVSEDIGPLSMVISLRSELLETEAFVQYELKNTDDDKDNTKNKDANKNSNTKNIPDDSIIDKFANVKSVVNSYIESSTKLVLDSINRLAILSITSSGSESIRESIDLYLLEKRKSSIDKNLTNLLTDYLNNDKTTEYLSINESIHAINELINSRPLDIENYVELTHLYLHIGKFKEALNCLSNAFLLGCSTSWNLWSLRGEICYLQSQTMDDTSGMKSWLFASVSSFSYSIELCDNYVRSWCGVYVSLNMLQKLEGNKVDDVYNRLFTVTVNKLNELKVDDSIDVQERDNIVWILENK